MSTSVCVCERGAETYMDIHVRIILKSSWKMSASRHFLMVGENLLGIHHNSSIVYAQARTCPRCNPSKHFTGPALKNTVAELIKLWERKWQFSKHETNALLSKKIASCCISCIRKWRRTFFLHIYLFTFMVLLWSRWADKKWCVSH